MARRTPPTIAVSAAVLVVTCILVAASYVPVWINYRTAPGFVTYMGQSEFPLDYYGQLLSIRDGYLGHWYRQAKITTTKVGYPAYGVKAEYVLLGQLGRVIGAAPPVMYTAAQIVLSAILLAVVIVMVRSVTDRDPVSFVAGYAFAILSTGISWSEADNWNSTTFFRSMRTSPHLMIGHITGLLFPFVVSRYLDGNLRFRYALPLSFAAATVCLFAYAPTALISISAAAIGTLAVLAYRWRRGALTARTIAGTAVLWAATGAVSVAVFLYMRFLSDKWDWSLFATTETLWNMDMTPLKYVKVVGTVVLLAAACYRYRGRGGSVVALLYPWLLLIPVGAFTGQYVHINPFRVFFTPYFAVFGLLAAAALTWIRSRVGAGEGGRRKVLVTAAIVCAVFVPSAVTYVKSITHNGIVYYYESSLYNYGYPRTADLSAIAWLERNTTERDIVLSGVHSGVLIPALAGNRVLTSWWHFIGGDPDCIPIIMDMGKFYRGEFTAEEAASFIRTHGIRYVYSGADERSDPRNGTPPPYPFLTTVYDNGYASVYRADTGK